ncbi:MAG: hypothetical protein U5L10_05155 [Candidatus Moranbacteria bacterium]|nr:hypothetical protein [Candidatus Moranbacteria bacterium]
MNSKNNRSGLCNKGAISAYVLIAASIAVTLLTSLAIFVASSQRRSSNEVSEQRALQHAEQGIYYYKWYLAHNLDGKNPQQIQDFWQNGSPVGVGSPYEHEVEDLEGNPVGKYKIEVTPPDPHSTIVDAVSSGWTYRHPDIVKKVKVRFRRPSWSEYSVLANDVMRFGEGTSVYGPIHSNNGIRFDGTANNKVTSSVEEYYDPDTNSYKPGVWTSQSNEDEVFLAGKEYPVPIHDFNSVTSDLTLIKEEAQASGLFFDEDTYEKEECGWTFVGAPPPVWSHQCNMVEKEVEGYHFTLRADDKVEVRRVLDYGGADRPWDVESYRINEETDAEVFDIPANGLIYANNHVWVDGEIDTARITIAAAKLNSYFDPDIYLNNDLTYTNKNGDDIIGLIAENDISVGLYSENELEINAALLAQKGRVGRNYYSSGLGSTVWRDEITVYGSIATNERYGFAWTDGTGYDIRNLYFDNNLKYFPPPYFPTGTVYELDLWQDLK